MNLLRTAKANPQPFLAGLGYLVWLVIVALVYQFDADPTTVPDWPTVGAAIMVLLGFSTTRQADKTSEEQPGHLLRNR